MNNEKISFAVFTKPWKTLSVGKLTAFVQDCGFDGIEFPLRSGYQVDLARMENELPAMVSQFSEAGLSVFSVASTLDESVFAACAKAGIPLIRIMVDIGEDGYRASEQRAKVMLREAVRLCERYGVKIGVQEHYGNCVSNAMGLLHLLEEFDPRYVGAIWDAAHDALAGFEPEHGLDIVWPYLAMVNLKNAYYVRVNGPEATEAQWKRYFTTGQHGLASWKRIADYLKQRDFSGTICLTAEYDDEPRVDDLIRQDIAYAKSLFEE